VPGFVEWIVGFGGLFFFAYFRLFGLMTCIPIPVGFPLLCLSGVVFGLHILAVVPLVGFFVDFLFVFGLSFLFHVTRRHCPFSPIAVAFPFVAWRLVFFRFFFPHAWVILFFPGCPSFYLLPPGPIWTTGGPF